MTRHRLMLLLLGALLTSSLVHAEVLRIPAAQGQAEAWVKVPPRGMTMKKVRKWFGDPVKKYPPVGKPPITRWEYPDYIVYFEYDRVITSVHKHQR